MECRGCKQDGPLLVWRGGSLDGGHFDHQSKGSRQEHIGSSINNTEMDVRTVNTDIKTDDIVSLNYIFTKSCAVLQSHCCM